MLYFYSSVFIRKSHFGVKFSLKSQRGLVVNIVPCKYAVFYMNQLRDKGEELAEKTEFAQEQEKMARESETKKEELKNRALETIKEYV